MARPSGAARKVRVHALQHAVVLMSVLATAHLAHARPGSFNEDAFDLSGALDRAVAATPTSLEVGVGLGYTQGVGGAGGTGSLEDVTGSGGSLELAVAARLTPSFSLGLYGTFARFQHGDMIADGSRVRAATAGVQATWHAREQRALDPWISVGTGWRGLWITPADGHASALHGVELLRVQLGIDYRFTERFAISPVIGVSSAAFMAERTAMTPGLAAVRDNRLNLYWFTGLSGRFDLGWSR
jgi:hypothetical protein